jgi:hypothetical protein
MKKSRFTERQIASHEESITPDFRPQWWALLGAFHERSLKLAVRGYYKLFFAFEFLGMREQHAATGPEFDSREDIQIVLCS